MYIFLLRVFLRCCHSYFLAAVRKHPDKQQLREERLYFGLWLRRGYSPWWRGGTTPGTGGQPSSQSGSRVTTFHPHMVEEERMGREREMEREKKRESEREYEREWGQATKHQSMLFCVLSFPVPCDILLPARLHLLKSPWPPQTVPPPGDKVLKYLMSLWRAFHIQITTDVDSLQNASLSVLESKDSFSGSFPLCVWDCMWRGTYCRANNGGQGPSPE